MMMMICVILLPKITIFQWIKKLKQTLKVEIFFTLPNGRQWVSHLSIGEKKKVEFKVISAFIGEKKKVEFKVIGWVGFN